MQRHAIVRGKKGRRLAESEEVLVLCSSDICLQHHACNATTMLQVLP
jgi:hypothetical protein